MDIPAEQISEDDVIRRQQEIDRESQLDDARPASFGEYLAVTGNSSAAPRERRRAAVTGLPHLAEQAKRAPRDG